MKCLILGAGYATRLYPLTRNRPKPLLPIGGVPMLTRICEQVFRVKQVDRIYLVSNHRFVGHYYDWLRIYEQSRSLPAPIEIFDDLTTSNEDRLGAIGDMQFVIQHGKIDDDMLIIAGDNMIRFSMQEFVDFGLSKGSAICLKDLGSKERVPLYAAVELDKKGKVIDFEEKPPRPQTSLVSIGVYCYGRKHVPMIKKYLDEGRSSDRPGNFVQWAHLKIDLYGYVIDGDWLDIGDIDSYNEANELYAES